MHTDPIQNEIEAKGLTAPRVTPADIETEIIAETYFTAAGAVLARWRQTAPGRVRGESTTTRWGC